VHPVTHVLLLNSVFVQSFEQYPQDQLSYWQRSVLHSVSQTESFSLFSKQLLAHTPQTPKSKPQYSLLHSTSHDVLFNFASVQFVSRQSMKQSESWNFSNLDKFGDTADESKLQRILLQSKSHQRSPM
jgi:hypothetical protein